MLLEKLLRQYRKRPSGSARRVVAELKKAVIAQIEKEQRDKPRKESPAAWARVAAVYPLNFNTGRRPPAGYPYVDPGRQ